MLDAEDIRNLANRVADRRKRRFEVRADGRDHGYNGDGNPSSNQSILNGSCSRVIVQEFFNIPHESTFLLFTWSVIRFPCLSDGDRGAWVFLEFLRKSAISATLVF